MNSGAAALDAIRDNTYDIVFLDLKMPGLNGVETLRLIRETGIDVPIYITTGFYEDFMQILKKVSSDGIDFEIIEKPVGRGQLVSVVEGVCSNILY